MKKFLSLMLAAVMSFSIITADIPAGAEESIQSKAQSESNTQLEGTNTFGSLLTQEIQTQDNGQLAGNGYNIVSVDVDKSTNKAIVEYGALKCCTLVVAVYNEAGTQLTASGSCEVNQFETSTTVDIEGTLPQYFYLKAYLVEKTTLRPLSKVYESPEYTKEMQDFFSKTTDSFDQERVLNLDSDKTNNFAVFNKDVKIIPQAEGVNTVKTADDANGLYVIENADENFTSLQPGDLFAYKYGESDIIIAKVGDISVNGTTVTVTGGETSLKEIFEYVRIDETADISSAEVDDSVCDEGITYEGLIEDQDQSIDTQENNSIHTYAEQGEVKRSIGFGYKLSIFAKNDFGTEISISGKLDSKYEITLKYYLSWTYQYLELKITDTQQWTVALTGKIKGEWTLANASIPLGATGINVNLKPKIIVEATAEINYSGKVTSTNGFAYDSDTGTRDLSAGPTTDSSCKIQGTLFIGVELEINLNILNENLAKAALKIRGGVELKAAIAQAGVGSVSSSERHSCVYGGGAGCYDGDINLKLRVNLEFVLLGFIKQEGTLVELTTKFADFYYSLEYDELGMGNCPHRDYLVEAKVKDESGKAIFGAKVIAGTFKDGTKYTDQNGVAKFYLSNGNYNLSAEKANYQKETSNITVGNSKKSISFVLGGKDYKMSISVKDESGKPVSGINVNAVMIKDKNGKQVDSYNQKTVRTNAQGVAVFDISSGTYSVSASDKNKGYASKSIYVYGTDKSDTLKLSSKVQNVFVKDEDSAAVADAFVTARMLADENGTAVPYADEIVVSTDADGKAVFAAGKGTYRVTVKKTGYKTASKSININDNSVDVEFTLSKGGNGTLKDIVKVSTGVDYYAAIDKNGDLWMWGSNAYGQLGNGTKTNSSVPIKVLENVADVSLGGTHSGAVTKDGALYMWGGNNNGQLGDGTYTESLVPKKIMTGIKTVSLCSYRSDYDYTAALTVNGDLLLWGYNQQGQLGDGTSIKRNTPLAIMNGVNYVNVDLQSAAVKNDGSLYTWGNNAWGQLGNGQSGGSYAYDDGIDSNVPIKIMDNIVSADMMDWGGSAIDSSNNLYLWGTSNKIKNSASPEVYLTGIKYASLGGEDTPFGAAITTDGSLTTFGSGYINTDMLSDVVDVCCGGSLGLAVTSDGTLYTWSKRSQPEIFSVDETSEQSTGGNNTMSVETQDAASVAETQNPGISYGGISVKTNASPAPKAVPTEKTAEFTELVPGDVYNIYLIRTRVLADPCGSGNLLYINQATADNDGKITLNYIPKSEFITTEIFAVGSQCSQHTYEKGECIYCGAVCEHSYDENDICTICGAENEGISGDCTLNGKVDIYDAIEIVRFIMDMRTFNEKEMLLADYNLDTNVDLYDAIGIAKLIMSFSR